jgi:flagellar assembly protein FliH
MSSKLHRGGVSMEPMVWRSIGERDACVTALQHSPNGNVAPGARAATAEEGEEQRTQAAYQQGLQEGHAAARQEMFAQVDAMNGRLARTIEELTGLRQRFRHEAEEDLVALALAIARRILHRELTMAPEALLGLVKAALEKIDGRELHSVRVRPEDAALIRQHFEKMGLPRRVEVIADPGLERGAAILDSSRGALDASVETQLAEIERGFADLVRRA